MNPEPRELCSSGIVSKNALQSRKKSLIRKMQMTDLLEPISESTHSNTDCWPSSAIATAVMCGINKLSRAKHPHKKGIKLSVSKLWTKEIFLRRSY